MIGVGFSDWLDPFARALAALGHCRGLVLHGADGLDEISLGSKTFVRYICDGNIEERVWEPSDFGLPQHNRNVFRVGSVPESAAMAEQAISGKDNAPRHIVLANAAAGLWLVGKAASLKEGVELAAHSIDSGKPREILDLLGRICPAMKVSP
jgi:anthranilate phosphoribosyltransferase